MDYKIDWNAIEWESPATGVQQKVVSSDHERIRLVQFTDAFQEEDWCMAGHVGLVLNGAMTIDFNGHTVQYSKGDSLFIPSGENHKHKACIAPGQVVELVLFERL